MKTNALSPAERQALLADGLYKVTIDSRVNKCAYTWNVNGVPLPVTELRSAANEVLAKALQTYDASRGASFQTYLWRCLAILCDTAKAEQQRLLREVRQSISFQGSIRPWSERECYPDEGVPMSQEVRGALQGQLLTGIKNFEEVALGLYLDDLSQDAQAVVACLIARGIRRGAYPTAKSVSKRMHWTKAKTEDAWEEIQVWLRFGGHAFERRELELA